MRLFCYFFVNLIGSGSAVPQFACSSCERVYCTKGALTRHQTWECGKTPSFQCVVAGCTSCFLRNDTLRGHLRDVHKFQLPDRDSSVVDKYVPTPGLTHPLTHLPTHPQKKCLWWGASTSVRLRSSHTSGYSLLKTKITSWCLVVVNKSYKFIYTQTHSSLSGTSILQF